MAAVCCSLVGEIHGHNLEFIYASISRFTLLWDYPAEPEVYTITNNILIEKAIEAARYNGLSRRVRNLHDIGMQWDFQPFILIVE